jgi:hypothetical protein
MLRLFFELVGSILAPSQASARETKLRLGTLREGFAVDYGGEKKSRTGY